MSRNRRTASRADAYLALALALSAMWSGPSPVSAADPRAEGAQHLMASRSQEASSYRFVYERVATPGGAGWSAKYVDPATGRVFSVERTPDGSYLDIGEQRSAAANRRAEVSTLERKADPAVLAAAATAPAQPLALAVWLQADTNAATASVVAAHPEVKWLAERPLVNDLALQRQLRAELWGARREAYAAAEARLAATVRGMGGSIGYASSSAPLLFVALPAGALAAIADLPSVTAIGLERSSRPTMSSAGPTVDANWTGGAGDLGTGVRVGVVEYHNVRNSGDLAGRVVRSYSTTGSLAYTSAGQFDHPTWVAGAIDGGNATYPGVAPGSVIVSAGTGGYVPSLATDRAIIAAADWAVSPNGGDADLLNLSLGQDTSTGAEEARRYFDAVSADGGRLVLAAAGNYVTFGHWDVLSPATGYNVAAVGGIDDRGTGDTGDDRIWFVPGSNGSNYRDPVSTAWNPHGDFNKPNVSAPAVNVRTANGLAASGTSVASPITAGIAAQLLAQEPALLSWPEATRAILAAGALRRTPMPDGSYNADHEGAGTVSAMWSSRILVDGGGEWGGYQIGVARDGKVDSKQFPVIAGQHVRVALAWSSHVSGPDLAADELLTDLDLTLQSPNGASTGSYTFDNAYEVVDVTAPSSGVMTVRVAGDRFDGGPEPYAVAWSIAGPFTDADRSPFASDIRWALLAGITAGCGPSLYCPNATVTREQMASFLVRALDLPRTGPDRFVDDQDSPHQSDINALAAAGLTSGCSSTEFCPREPVTRDQMASFLARALGLSPSSRDMFGDDNGNLHERNINALAIAAITGGCAPGRYCPAGAVTRGQMAAFLRRAFSG
jgi:hypothetical protein